LMEHPMLTSSFFILASVVFDNAQVVFKWFEIIICTKQHCL
jgi:hypothetical protein